MVPFSIPSSTIKSISSSEMRVASSSGSIPIKRRIALVDAERRKTKGVLIRETKLRIEAIFSAIASVCTCASLFGTSSPKTILM